MKGEVILLYLFDVGRYIDLIRVSNVYSGIQGLTISVSKDTPPYIHIPKPLILENPSFSLEISKIMTLKGQIKIYEDGVISFVARINFADMDLFQLPEIFNIRFNRSNHSFTVHEWIMQRYQELMNKIEDYVEKYVYEVQTLEYEHYTIFCLNDITKNPSEFVTKNSKFFANLLIGENINTELHESRIADTLANSFSYLKNDLTIFDLNCCLIIDSSLDYEDVLLIIELSIFQRLELRVLDNLLDTHLNVLEGDIRKLFFKRKTFGQKLTRKLGRLFRLRYDMLFILENIENVSKIIGDFYLARLYSYLGELFRLDQWSQSIRYRLNILGDIYGIAKSNTNERVLLIIEILLGLFFIFEFIFLLLGL